MSFGSPVYSPDPTNGHHWDSNNNNVPNNYNVTWNMPLSKVVGSDKNTYFTSNIANSTYSYLVQRAFDLWQDVSGLHFTRVNSPTANIEVGFDNIVDSKGNIIGSGQTVLAGEGTILQTPVVVRIEDPTFTSLVKLPDYDYQYAAAPDGFTLFNTIVHEIGHALGLAHNLVDPYSVMYDGNANPENSSIDTNDLKSIQQLYGVPYGPMQPLVMRPSATQLNPIGNDGVFNLFNHLNVTDIPGLGMQIQIKESGVGGVLNDPFASGSPDVSSHESFDQSAGILTENGVDAIPYTTAGVTNYATAALEHITYKPPSTGGIETFTVKVTDSLGRTATSTLSVTSNRSVYYRAPATQPATPLGSTATLPSSTAAVTDPNVVTIPLGSLTATISPSMEFLPSGSSPLAGDVRTLEASSSITDFAAGLKTLFADVKAAGLTASWSDMSVPQPSQTLTIADHGNAVLSLNLSGATDDPTVASALALLKSFSV